MKVEFIQKNGSSQFLQTKNQHMCFVFITILTNQCSKICVSYYMYLDMSKKMIVLISGG
jgi:hypothetical protein